MSEAGKLTVGSLFAGIGGFDLGLERTGCFETRWFCEVDPYARRVLAKHWPGVQCHGDITALRADEVEPVDVLCGGFPCPVVSQAARGRNVAAWLWPEYARLICELRPRYVVVENVEGLLYRDRGFGDILGDLASVGLDATWRVLRASDVGAPHHRSRVWLVGHPNGNGKPDLSVDDETPWLPELRPGVRGWSDPPRGLGVAHGVPARVDRLRSLGNALVPQIAEWLGYRIAEYEGLLTGRNT